MLTFERIDDLTRPLAGPADAVFWAIFYVIVMPLGLLVEALIYLFRLLIHPGSPAQPPQAPSLDWVKALREQAQGGAGPPAVLLVAAKWAVGIVLALIILALLARAVFRFAEWRSDDGVEEDRDFVWSWSTLGEGIQRLFQFSSAGILRR